MKYFILIMFIFLNQFVFSQSNTNRKPVTIDGSEFESIEASKIKAEKQIQIKDSIDKAIADSIELAEAKLMEIETEKANSISDSLNNLKVLPAFEAHPAFEAPAFEEGESIEIDTTEWRILYEGENTNLELSKEEIWQKADTKIAHLNRTSEDYIKMAKSCSNTRGGNYLAVYFYTKAIDKNINCFDCYFEKALRNKSIDSKAAILDFKKALKINPKCSKCCVEIARVYLYDESNRNFLLARSYYYRALKTLKCETEEDFNYQNSIIDGIGMTWIYEYGTNDKGFLKNRKVRLHVWDSLVKATNLTRYYKERASLKEDKVLNDQQGALKDYLYVLNNQKRYDSRVAWGVADTYFELGNYFDAVKYYNEVIEHKSELEMNRNLIDDLMRLYFAKGNCKMNLQDYRGGKEDYQTALNYCLSLNDKYNIYLLWLYNNIGKAKILLNENKSALAELSKAIEFQEGAVSVVNNEAVRNYDLAYAYYLLGAANYKLYENNSIYSYKDDACKAWSKAGDLGNKEAYTYIKDYCNN